MRKALMLYFKSRSELPPGGWFYRQPQTGWPSNQEAAQMAGWTFDELVDRVIAMREANPRFNLPMDRATVEFEVEIFNALRVAGMKGGRTYLTDRRPLDPKKYPPQSLQRPVEGAGTVGGGVVSNITAGVRILLDWLGAGGIPVAAALAEKRAWTCAVREDGKGCPVHRPSHWYEWAKDALAASIKEQVELKTDMRVATSLDDKLKTCGACLCWLPLKVQVPVEHIIRHSDPDTLRALDPGCWVTREGIASRLPSLPQT